MRTIWVSTLLVFAKQIVNRAACGETGSLLLMISFSLISLSIAEYKYDLQIPLKTSCRSQTAENTQPLENNPVDCTLTFLPQIAHSVGRVETEAHLRCSYRKAETFAIHNEIIIFKQLSVSFKYSAWMLKP